MLNRLTVKNIALINELNVELSGGMNVLSGETGAGKSIIIDSLNLVLGERADRDMIRTGAGKAVVEAWFIDVPKSAEAILTGQEIEPEPELVLSRELSTNGKNVCRVNGVLVSLSTLKEIGDVLVDIHGQHEHQSLFNEKNHLELLDGFDNRIGIAKGIVAEGYKAYITAVRKLKSLFGTDGERERRIDVLKFQINEITTAKIAEGEEDDLNAQKKKLNAAEKIMDVLNASYHSLYESEAGSLLAALKEIRARFEGIAPVDEKYAGIAEKVGDAYYTLEDMAGEIREEMNTCQFDAGALEDIEERLSLIGNLKRKYGDPCVTSSFLRNAEQELRDLIDSERLITELTEKIDRFKKELYERSVRLSEMRREAAVLFQQKMMQQLSDLGMASSSFSVRFEDLKSPDACVYSKEGIDTVAFYISTNKGEPQKPLKKIISGGEVSRIMLALKNIAADKGGIPTMIFDEIDTGISGRMAQVVAEKLYSISKDRQVLCVTHLPQIASMADRHLLVIKESDDTATKTCLVPLEGQSRIDEIARLSGGESDIAKQHAREMLNNSAGLKTTG